MCTRQRVNSAPSALGFLNQNNSLLDLVLFAFHQLLTAQHLLRNLLHRERPASCEALGFEKDSSISGSEFMRRDTRPRYYRLAGQGKGSLKIDKAITKIHISIEQKIEMHDSVA
ncbi:hypothetical protein C0Q70_01604 [Pomacea canaliculata]|uniref:Uncharacterized protein n=1 Tax=Pomacea canaliculata TaxID=400727 RepID=A0A2T7PZY7_POMCA|nr:hypothetical protein C0Q70_01604 [Pomacea canaliculata]